MSASHLITPDRLIEVEPTHCWLWQGSRNSGDPKRGVVAGYGYFKKRGGRAGRQRIYYVHRTLYEELVGPIPDGLEIDHLCRVHACCNPGHLEPVTRAENLRRGKGTRLTKEDVATIRSSPLTNLAMAKRFGVHNSHISRIRAGKKWAES